MGDFQMLLRLIPEDWQKLSGVKLTEVATHAGRVALAFVDPVVVLGATVWGVTRGSDTVAGPLERGTMEMVLAAPVRRWAVYASHAAATVTGSVGAGAVPCHADEQTAVVTEVSRPPVL
jgi:ABC-type transport system involved in multi-copper enzyme maturation permease subunit